MRAIPTATSDKPIVKRKARSLPVLASCSPPLDEATVVVVGVVVVVEVVVGVDPDDVADAEALHGPVPFALTAAT